MLILDLIQIFAFMYIVSSVKLLFNSITVKKLPKKVTECLFKHEITTFKTAVLIFEAWSSK